MLEYTIAVLTSNYKNQELVTSELSILNCFAPFSIELSSKFAPRHSFNTFYG
jgi:hypothetical protein